MPTIRSFDRETLPYAVELCKELHGLGSFSHITFDYSHTVNQCINAARNPDWFCRIAQNDEGEYVGLMCGHVTPFVFSPRLLAVEDAWYVRAGTTKRTSIGVKMMREFIAWSFDTKNVVHIQSGDVANIESKGVAAIYQHLGFKVAGTVYKYVRKA